LIVPVLFTKEVQRVVPLGIKSLPKEQERRIHLMHLQGITLQSASASLSINADDVDALFDELHTCVAWLVHEVRWVGSSLSLYGRYV
jgi:hypothetical protein